MQKTGIINYSILDSDTWISLYKANTGLSVIIPLLSIAKNAGKLFLFVILISGGYVYGQQSDYKLNPSDVSISSKGDKNGLVPWKDSYMYSERTDKERGDIPKFRGKKNLHPYKIANSRYISHSIIKRSIGANNEVRIKILKNGTDNTDIEDFSMAYDSGTEYHMSNVYGIQNTSLPLYVKVTYRSWNAFHAVQSDVVFEFSIYSPGTWDITLFN